MASAYSPRPRWGIVGNPGCDAELRMRGSAQTPCLTSRVAFRDGDMSKIGV